MSCVSPVYMAWLSGCPQNPSFLAFEVALVTPGLCSSTEGLCSSPTTSRSSQAKTLFLGTDHSGYILLKLALGMCLWL